MTLHRVTFEVRSEACDDYTALTVTPYVDGTSLVDLATTFEQRREFDVAGGYFGIIPGSFNFGELTAYYLGTQARQWPEPEHAWLLGCSCGEVGCWPLTARVVLTDETVTWTDFAQEHRPGRDYTGLGPFVFDRTEYERAVRTAVSELG